MYAASLAWFTTKKLGSLLDDAAHLHARKRLAISGLHNLPSPGSCVVSIFHPNTLADVALKRCDSIPLSEIIVRQQRRLVGHVLA
ncbi:hypothetical protein SPRG_04390 [Saprolegnia parasitica CBS 223.65]|uniref:Uncharacterized protein n=1 Tax=Saprolegnia parasitica (strain CBS 223.65) TaxID=695850 RepID=A0A067CUK9_SAPPC|nr:hypothetical protein SPRG_04390 [Saprolegnia parasitica CBS 223.65]KDO30487.1 hypothetical protein SPRG_04390 [Saprolegnia parasitica CBS 223.65]|eukprot:XP_012198709.1 hypothetical protein SPRG_04390 [Saprolegnia parasitica CBS 223.65]